MSTVMRKVVLQLCWHSFSSTGISGATTQLKPRPDEAQYEQKVAHEVRHQLVLLP